MQLITIIHSYMFLQAYKELAIKTGAVPSSLRDLEHTITELRHAIGMQGVIEDETVNSLVFSESGEFDHEKKSAGTRICDICGQDCRFIDGDGWICSTTGCKGPTRQLAATYPRAGGTNE